MPGSRASRVLMTLVAIVVIAGMVVAMVATTAGVAPV